MVTWMEIPPFLLFGKTKNKKQRRGRRRRRRRIPSNKIQ